MIVVGDGGIERAEGREITPSSLCGQSWNAEQRTPTWSDECDVGEQRWMGDPLILFEEGILSGIKTAGVNLP
jgi:hypothetical protein